LKSKTIAIVGTGLIGASVGLALRRRGERGLAIVGWDPSARNARAARRRHAIDSISNDLTRAIERADTVVIAAPLSHIVSLVTKAIKYAKRGALIIDVGGLKQAIAATAARALRQPASGALFVAGHPMAGSERAGPEAAAADLFDDRPFAIYAPVQHSRARAWRAAETFVRALGGFPVRIDPADHDRIVAATSALPQLAALAIARAAARAAGKRGARLVGPGLAGATRLAESPFSVWEIALLENRRNVRRALRALGHEIGIIDAALERGDARRLEKIFLAAAGARRRICSGRGRTKSARSS